MENNKKVIDKSDHFENYCIKIEYNNEKDYTKETYLDFGEDEDLIIGKKRHLQMIKNYRVNSFVADLRDFKGASPEASLWVTNEWFPEVVKFGLKNIAYILGEDVFAQFSVETAISSDFAKQIKIEKFLTLKEAEEWLNNQ